MLLVKDLWSLPNCKTFGWSRVKTRWCIMYLGETCALYLLVRPWVRRELRLRNVSCERTCAAYVIVRPSVGRDVPYLSTHATVLTISTSHRPGKHSQDLDMFKYRRIEVEIKTRCCIIYLCGETNLHYLLTCKALGETRVTTRKCFMKNLCCLFDWKAVGGSRVKARWYFMYLGGATCPILLHLYVLGLRRELPLEEAFMWRTCVVYSTVRPSVGRGLRLDDVSCTLGGNLRYVLTC